MVDARYSSGARGGTLSSRTHSFSERNRLDQARETFPSAQVLARLLDRLVGPDETSSPLSQFLEEHPNAGLAAALNQLNPSQRSTLDSQVGGNFLQQMTSLSHEGDGEMFLQGLHVLGLQLMQAERVNASALSFQTILGVAQQNPELARLEVVTEARQQSEVLQGGGPAGLRLEFFGQRFAAEVSNPAMIGGMVVGTGLFSVSRSFFLSRLLGARSLPWLARAVGAETLASVGAFGLEAPAFWATSKGLQDMISGGQRWDLQTNLHELAGTFLTLGALKLCGTFSQSMFNRVHGLDRLGQATRLSGITRWSQDLFPQAGMLAGIYLGRRAEEAFNLRTAQGEGDRWFDSLLMLVQFNAGGRLSEGLLGRDFVRFRQELEFRSRWAAQHQGPPNSGGLLRPVRQWLQENFGPKAVTEQGVFMSMPEDEGLPGLRSVQMTMLNDGRGGADPLARFDLLQEVFQKAKQHELGQFKELIWQVFKQATGFEAGEVLTRRFSSPDPEDWRLALQIALPTIRQKANWGEVLQNHAPLREFLENWVGRQHFQSPSEIIIEPEGKISKPQRTTLQLAELKKALVQSPDIRGWNEFSRRQASIARREANKVFQMEEVRSADGSVVFSGNWYLVGLTIRFDSRGQLVLPLQIRRPFSEGELPGHLSALREKISIGTPAKATSAGDPSLAMEFAEAPAAWALRLLERAKMPAEANSTQPSPYLQVAEQILASLKDPAQTLMARAAVERMAVFTQDSSEGILVRKYHPARLDEPLTILSLPSTFLPEAWSRVFAEGVEADFQRSGQKVPRAVEIGSGTGWMSILMSRWGMADEILGLDYNPEAKLVGEINALLNGATGVKFLTSDLLSALPEDYRADLIVACIPQVPAPDSLHNLREGADYYVSQGNYWDNFGLGLVDRALGQSRDHLSEQGRVLFNLGGRPGKELLEEMLTRRGFHPTMRLAQLIPQDPGTSIEALAERERRTGHRFEFFLDDPSQSISAQEAQGQKNLFHFLYLMEGRPYQPIFRQNVSKVFSIPQRWGYTAEPGQELLGLSQALQKRMTEDWGNTFSPETFFVSPSAENFLESWIKLAVPESGVLLTAGSAPARLSRLMDRLDTRSLERLPLELPQITAQIQKGGVHAAVVEWPMGTQRLSSEIADLVNAAIDQKTYLLFVEPFPRHRLGSSDVLTEAMSGKPEALEVTSILQPLDERFGLNDFPLAVGIIGNSELHGLMSRYAEITYSRASTPQQTVYQNFLTALGQGSVQSDELSNHLDSVLTGFSIRSHAGRILETSSAFKALPKGEHPDPIDMSFGESEWSPPVSLIHAGLKAARVTRQETEGLVREAAVRYLSESRGVEFKPKQIVVGAGVHPLIYGAMKGIQDVHPGRPLRVLIAQPSYGLFYPTVELAGAQRFEVPTSARNRFLMGAGDLSNYLQRPEARPISQSAVLLNLPTNPAGQYYQEAEFREVLEMIRRNDAYLLLDDVFGQLHLTPKPPTRESYVEMARQVLKHRLVTFTGLSKEFSAGGLRVGFAASDHPDVLKSMQRYLPSAPDTLGMQAALDLLPQWRVLTEAHRNYLYFRMNELTSLLRDKTIPFQTVQGGYSVMVDFTKLIGRNFNASLGQKIPVTLENLHELLFAQAGIKIHSDQWTRVPGQYRFVFSIERMSEVIQRLKRFFRNVR